MYRRILVAITMAGIAGCIEDVAQTASKHTDAPAPTAPIETEAAPTIEPTQTSSESPEQTELDKYFVQPQIADIHIDLVYHTRDTPQRQSVFGFNVSLGEIVSLVEVETTNLQAFIQPDAWSPSGEGFLLLEEVDTVSTREYENYYYRVYFVDLAGKLVRPLFDFFYHGIWAGEIYITTTVWWSPTGERIAYSGVDPEGAYIAIYSLSEQAAHKVFEVDSGGTDSIRLLGWAVDGNSLFFISNFGRDTETYMGRSGIYSLDLLTGETEEIFYDEHMGILDAKLSPQDSNLIALEANGPDLHYFAWKLFLLDISADQMFELVPDEQWPIQFSFSPDGQFLAFSQLHQNKRDLCIREISSMQTSCGLLGESLLEQGALRSRLRWLPNSREIALPYFISDERCHGTVVVNLAGELQEAISDRLAALCNIEVLSWNPAFSE